MGIFFSMVWIIAGVAYVVYRLTKEEGVGVLGGVIGFIGVIALMVTLTGSGAPHLLIVILAFGGAYICNLAIKKIESPEAQQKKMDKIRENFVEYCKSMGYNMPEDEIDCLMNSSMSPYRYPESTIHSSYTIWCWKRSFDMDKWTDSQISDELGMPILLIPLDSNMSSRDAIYKRQLYAKDFILKRKGLRYVDTTGGRSDYISNKYFNPSDNYGIFFDNYVENYLASNSQK